jgi:hypothetical protein
MPPRRQPSTKLPPFNWVTYLDNYPELREKGINNAKLALNHWNKSGRKEGRVYTKLESTDTTTLIPDKYKPVIYIISNLEGGGAVKYLDDITSKYSTTRKFVYITTQKQLDSYTGKYTKSLIFLQHLINTDIKLENIIKIKATEQCKLIISIHDFYWLCDSIGNLYKPDNCHNTYLCSSNISILHTVLNIFAIADEVICNSKFTYTIYPQCIQKANYILEHVNDYPVNFSDTCYIQPIIDNTINIGVLHSYSVYKGKELIEKLLAKYTTYKSFTIKWHIVGHTIPVYKEHEFYDWLKRYNIHALTSLNKWGETWGYAMTKFINSGLPLIYNNFGAYKERFEGNNRAHYFKCYDMETEYDVDYANDVPVLCQRFENMLDYVIVNQGQEIAPEPITEIQYSAYYNKLFGPVQILPFAIYFPQFHPFPENDKNYYPGMTDMTNLELYFKENPDNPEGLERPDMSVYGLHNMEDYRLDNPDLVNKQVELAKQHGIRGFAIYYYWFSDNTITNKHTIMESCHDNFFKTPYEDFKVYFTWANENWCSNIAFNNPGTILNTYTSKNIFDNCKLLVEYFTHVNYYKIDNKPVFGIHHPFLLPSTETIDEIYYTLNTLCMENGFAGVTLIVNSIVQTYPKYKNYLMHPNYKNIKYEIKTASSIKTDSLINNKNIKNSRKCIDYTKYIDLLKLENTCINTIYFDFNNTARMYKPDNLNNVTQFINITDSSIKQHIIQVKQACYANTYSLNELDRIVLINAWNEWTEKMHIEPSIESGTKLLDMLKVLNDL